MRNQLTIDEYTPPDATGMTTAAVFSGDERIIPPTNDYGITRIPIEDFTYALMREYAEELAAEPQFNIPKADQKAAAKSFLAVLLGCAYYDLMPYLQPNGLLGMHDSKAFHAVIGNRLSNIITQPDAFVLNVLSDCNKHVHPVSKKSPFQTMLPMHNAEITIDIMETHKADTISAIVNLRNISGSEEYRSIDIENEGYAMIQLAAQKLARGYWGQHRQIKTAENAITALLLEFHDSRIIDEALDDPHQPSLEKLIRQHQPLITTDPAKFIDTVSNEFQDYLRPQGKEKPAKSGARGYFIKGPHHVDDSPGQDITGPYYHDHYVSTRGKKPTYFDNDRLNYPNNPDAPASSR